MIFECGMSKTPGSTPRNVIVAWALYVPTKRLYPFVAGKRAMTVDTALRLGQWLGVEAALWMNLQ